MPTSPTHRPITAIQTGKTPVTSASGLPFSRLANTHPLDPSMPKRIGSRWSQWLNHLLSSFSLAPKPLPLSELPPAQVLTKPLPPPDEDFVTLRPELTGLDWHTLPKGHLCDWAGSSAHRQSKLLQSLVGCINAMPIQATPTDSGAKLGRCALIDYNRELRSASWRLLSASGLNWLIRPESLQTALQSALMLLASQEFSLVVLFGLSIEDLHPQDARLLKESTPAHTSVLFLHSYSSDDSGEPLAPDHCA